MTNVQCPINRCALDYPDHPAIITNRCVYSYKRLEKVVSSVSETLKTLGIEPGQRVGVLARNSPDYIITILSLIRLGAIFCPVNSRLPEQIVSSQLERITCRTILSDEDVHGIGEAIRLIRFESFVTPDITESKSNQRPSHVEIPLNHKASIIFTSGSSGDAKAVLHSYANHWYNAKGANKNIKIQPGDRWLLSLPLYHVGGLAILFRCFLAGAAVVISRDEVRLEDVFRDYHITHVSFVPIQLKRLLNNSTCIRALRNLKGILIGGQGVPIPLIKAAYENKLPVSVTYGCTEMASQVTTTQPGYARRKSFLSALAVLDGVVPSDGERACRGTPRSFEGANPPVQPTRRAGISCGVPSALKTTIPGSTYFNANETPSRTAPCTGEGLTPSVSIESVDQLSTSGRVLRYGQIRIADDGEILLKGKTLFMGYIDGNKLILPLDKDGWYHTNDVGAIDRQGCLTVNGRRDNMFISGGENIYPEEIEKRLNGISGISESIVVPASDDEFGFRPVAFVKTIDRKQLDIKDVSECLRKWLPGFKIPVQLLEWPNSEKTELLKSNRVYFKRLVK